MVETMSQRSHAPSYRSKASKAPSVAASSRAAAESSDDEPTAAQERARFIALTRGGFTEDDEDVTH